MVSSLPLTQCFSRRRSILSQFALSPASLTMLVLVALVNDAQPFEREQLVHLLDRLRFRRDHVGQAARRDDARIGSELLADPADDAVHLSGIAENDAGLHRSHGIAADDAARPDKLDSRQLGRFLVKRFRRDADARHDGAAQISAARIDIIEGRRRTEIDDDERRAVFLDAGDRIHDAVRSDLARILVPDVEARLDAGTDDERGVPKVVDRQLLQRPHERRHDRRDDDSVDGIDGNAGELEEVVHHHAVLVARRRAVGAHAPVMEQLLSAVDAEHDIRIAYVDDDNHGLRPPLLAAQVEADIESFERIREGADGNDVHAGLGDGPDRFQPHPARRFRKDMGRTALDQTNGLRHKLRLHIVEHDDVRAAIKSFADLLHRFRLDLDLHRVRDDGTGRDHGRGDAAGSLDMVVLDHDGVVQAEAVIGAAADADGVLLQHPVARSRLAGVDQTSREPVQNVDEAACLGGDARQALHQVEREPLARQNAVRAAFHLGDDGSRRYPVAVLCMSREGKGWIDDRKDGLRDGQAGDNPVFLDVDDGFHVAASRNGRAGRHIPGADILGQPALNAVAKTFVITAEAKAGLKLLIHHIPIPP
ncbi:hypothetical protein BN871_AB_01020 [Paenibacillus sp. P22]|nr:hypothetical protein BN871_AB_01020 [Paenibacillus sp. P22]